MTGTLENYDTCINNLSSIKIGRFRDELDIHYLFTKKYKFVNKIFKTVS